MEDDWFYDSALEFGDDKDEQTTELQVMQESGSPFDPDQGNFFKRCHSLFLLF
jgi:hypothetical protein